MQYPFRIYNVIYKALNSTKRAKPISIFTEQHIGIIMHLPRALFITLACYFSMLSQSAFAGDLGIDWPQEKMVDGKYIPGPAFEQCTAFGDRYANIATIEDEGENKSGNYFSALKVIKSMETQTEWVCLIQYNVAMFLDGQHMGDFQSQELHHVNKQTGKFKTTPTELSDL